eukprot:3731265-Pleurochrysis_carterae.AAC.2
MRYFCCKRYVAVTFNAKKKGTIRPAAVQPCNMRLFYSDVSRLSMTAFRSIMYAETQAQGADCLQVFRKTIKETQNTQPPYE